MAGRFQVLNRYGQVQKKTAAQADKSADSLFRYILILTINKKNKFKKQIMTKMVKKLMTEEEVKNSIIKHLSKENWGSFKFGSKSEKGPDIIAKHIKYPRYFIIETKGDGSKRTPSKNEVNFIYGLGQLITRITTIKKGYYYGLGLPEQSAKIALRRIPIQLAKEIKLHIFSVSDDGKVTKYKPSDIGKYQAKV